MRELMRRRPSAAMVVAIVALVVAASGTAVAATKLVSGDSLIKKNSLSGNRLRAHTVSGKQINLSSLGTVRNAAHATTADTATNATQAANATNATTAGSAPIAKLTYVTTSFAVPGDGTTTTGTASCRRVPTRPEAGRTSTTRPTESSSAASPPARPGGRLPIRTSAGCRPRAPFTRSARRRHPPRLDLTKMTAPRRGPPPRGPHSPST